MPAFAALATTVSGTIVLNGPIEAVFPLFSPRGEEKWVDGWLPEILFPRDSDWAERMVFRTSMGDQQEIWIVAELDRDAHHVVYYRVEPDRLVARVEVNCGARGANETEARVTYSYVGLSAAGNEEIAGWTDGVYAAKMARWEKTINAYLRK